MEDLLLSVFAETQAEREKREQKNRRDDDHPSGLDMAMSATSVPIGHQG